MRQPVRAFVAIELLDRAKDALARVVGELRAAQLGGLRAVRPEGIHLTLKFLGDVPADRIDAIGGRRRASRRSPHAVRPLAERGRRVSERPRPPCAVGRHRRRPGQPGGAPGERRRLPGRPGLCQGAPARSTRTSPSPGCVTPRREKKGRAPYACSGPRSPCEAIEPRRRCDSAVSKHARARRRQSTGGCCACRSPERARIRRDARIRRGACAGSGVFASRCLLCYTCAVFGGTTLAPHGRSELWPQRLT